MFDFLVHAMTDCVAKGSQEFFVAFSSHGTGYAGYGGDDHQEMRKLGAPQPNGAIANTLKEVLAAVEGAPDMYDVIGFDACKWMDILPQQRTDS